MKKLQFYTTVSILLVFVLTAFNLDNPPGKKSIGSFWSMRGFIVFYLAEPVHEYEILQKMQMGNVDYYGPTRSLGFLIDKINKKSPEADAIVVVTEDMDNCNIIKFKNPGLSKEEMMLGSASVVNGTYLFYRSEPVQPYEVMCELKLRAVGQIGPGTMTNELWVKMNKKCPEAEALIITSNMHDATAVKFKD